MAFKRSSELHSRVSNNWMILTLIFIGTTFHVHATPSVPAIFVFGDSTADVGTNNYLPLCGAKANMQFHGIDYPGSKPTGRFSNGYNTIDFLAQFLGFKESPPPYLFLVKNQNRGFMRHILAGANFASGGSGLLNITGERPYKQVVPISEQIQQFKAARSAISKSLMTTSKMKDLISKSVFIFSAGSNDIFEHFIYDKIPPKGDMFIRNLMSTYEKNLKGLVKLGAKRVAIVGVSPIGCVPSLRSRSPTFACLEQMNVYAKQFNIGLETLLKRVSLQTAKPLKYSILKAYEMTNNLIKNPTKYGIKDEKSACCGNGEKLNAEQPCNQKSKVCKDRKKQLFWDQFHPTEKVYKHVADALYNGGFHVVAPLNISNLATLRI